VEKSDFIPVSGPWLDIREEALALEALRSGRISGSGIFVERFERAWADVCGRRHGVAVSSGTAALETAFFALDLPRGSEVVMPDFCMIACLAAVLRNGLTPAPVDADPQTWCMDVSQMESVITSRTSAILAVHTYGHPVDMSAVETLARRHGLKIVEDAAEAHGASWGGRICGGFGDISTFSFYGNKIVTCGEGGMALCDDDGLAGMCRTYRELGFSATDRFRHEIIGQSFRLTNLQAAIGCAQTAKLSESLARKQNMARMYETLLSSIPDLQLPARPAGGVNAYWVYGVVLGESHRVSVGEVRRRLLELGVDTRPFFVGMHEQPVAARMGLKFRGAFPVSERLSRRGFYLPSGVAISEEQIHRVAEALKSALRV